MILYLGDFDPSGEDIFRHIKDEVSERFPNVILEKVAIAKKDIRKYRLPTIPAKRTDPRYRKFVEKHGRRGVELDALPPPILLERVSLAILRYMDMGARARSTVETFIQASLASLVDYALKDLSTRLMEVAQARLLERLDTRKLVVQVRKALEAQKKLELEIPDTLRRSILTEVSSMLGAGP